MRRICAALLSLAVVSSAMADESCGVRVARHLSAGDTNTLMSLFKNPSVTTSKQIDNLVSRVGRLTDISPADRPRFAQSIRHGAVTSGLPTTAAYQSQLINAQSPQLGAVQLQIGIELNTSCSVLVIYLDVDAKAKVSAFAQPLFAAQRDPDLPSRVN